MTEATIRTLDRIFNARAVAVVGASNDPGKFGYMTMNSIISGGYEGELFPINPKGGEILGRKVYTSLAELPRTPDLAAIIIPAQMVPGAVLEAAKLGVPGAMIMSGGFREAGRADLEAEVGAISREYGIRILGPNIQGINYLPNKLCAMFLPVIKTRGPLAVITQSGSVTAALIEWAADEGLGISAAVNLGNQVDLCESDYIEFFAQDDNTKAIVLYLESVKNGRRFLNTVKQAALKKPVCILKTGRTAEGKKAAASHTGSLAGNFEVFSGVCRQLGVFCAEDLEHLYDGAKALAAVRPPQGNRLMFVTTSGGAATLASDLVKEAGLVLPALSQELVSELKTCKLPALAILSNPLDMAGGILAEYFERSVLAADRQGAADIYFFSFADPVVESAEMLQRVAPQLQGSLAVLYMGGGEQEKIGRVKMHQAGFPVFPTPERAIRGLAAVMAARSFKAGIDAEKGAEAAYLWDESKPREPQAKPAFVLEPEAVRRLAEFNIPYPAHALASDADEAVKAADKMGYPVVLKIVSPQVIHKSEAGGVAVGLATPGQVRQGFQNMVERVRQAAPGADIKGVLVCRQAKAGAEVIIGALDDPDFGPTIMFGSGGVFTEIMRDVTFRVAPLRRRDAEEMIAGIKGYPLLTGARGRPRCDLGRLAELLVDVSRLVTQRPDIKELDLNPVRVYEKGLLVLDARMMSV